MRYLVALLMTAACVQAAAPATRVLYFVNQTGGDPASVQFDKNVRLVDTGSGPKIVLWDVPGVPRPYNMDALVDGSVVDAWYEEYRAAQAQLNKPAEQKLAENQYFELVKAVLTAIGDERKDLPATPKLSFQELNTLIETLSQTNLNAATLFSLKLLSTDALLKRFDTLWWDNAKYHDL